MSTIVFVIPMVVCIFCLWMLLLLSDSSKKNRHHIKDQCHRQFRKPILNVDLRDAPKL